MSAIRSMMRGGAGVADAPELPDESTKLANSQIRADGGTQMREQLDPTTCTEYRMAWLDGAQFPAVVVFYDGSSYWLADGFHRLESHIKAFGPGAEIVADVRAGTRRDAILHAARANASHGLRRTNQDKLRAVRTLLSDPDWSQWSDNQIAKACAVSQPFVSTHRKQLEATGEINRSLVRKTASGATMDTSRIGNTPKAATKPAPVASSNGTYNDYKSDEARPFDYSNRLVELSTDVIGELITVIDQNGLNFLMRKSSVTALRKACVEALE